MTTASANHHHPPAPSEADLQSPSPSSETSPLLPPSPLHPHSQGRGRRSHSNNWIQSPRTRSRTRSRSAASSSSSSSSSSPSPTRGHRLPVEDDTSHPASLLSCFLNLSNVAIGVGTLSLPRAFANVGWVGGLFLTAIACISSSLSLYMLVVAADATGATGYTHLAATVLKKKSWIVTWVFFVLVIGSLSAYFSVIQEYLSSIIDSLLPLVAPTTPPATRASIHQFALVAVTMLCLYPLSKARSMASLAWVSSLGLAAILFVAVLVPVSYLNDLHTPSWTPPPTKAIVPGWQWAPVFSTIAMAFINHSNVIEIAREMNPAQVSRTSPSTRVIPSTVAAAAATRKNALLIILTGLFVTLTYVSVAIPGYFHYGARVAPNILTSEPASAVFVGARAAILVCIILTFPLLVLPCRLCLAQMADEIRAWRAERTNSLGNRSGTSGGKHDEAARAGDLLATLPSATAAVDQAHATIVAAGRPRTLTGGSARVLVVSPTLAPTPAHLDPNDATDALVHHRVHIKRRGSQASSVFAAPVSPRSPYVHQSSVSPLLTPTPDAHQYGGTDSPLLTPRASAMHVLADASPPFAPHTHVVDDADSTHLLVLPAPIESWIATKAAAIMLLSWLISVLVPSLDRILGLTGSVAGSLVVYVFPAYCYLQLAREGKVPRQAWLRWCAYACLVLGGVLFVVGGVTSLVQVGRGKAGDLGLEPIEEMP
ncbi:transmembrane amino acid transporter protein-domain-containing protein [Catenaria anguillulae PL171]|uniref:Transmembrane amino acid transporter protein-domain-containing protein n=1 Tax=Catenaria anguillulae PL171 TaxID=765915 RepID=A0A1Y2HJK1_9FUNG|nr:transmembrane amino acid transporter protein-domain-containing protein [Catenaria anguillulae PL171]